jgi:predicted dehydrogenase
MSWRIVLHGERSMTMRAGLVGSGPWAAMVHAPGLAEHAGVRFSHLWARNAEAGAELARRFGVELCSTYDDLLEAVDLVSLCVPPSVQAPLAVAARQRGKLTLLEKPIADTLGSARDVVSAGAQGATASVVNYSLLLDDAVQPWVEDAAARRWAAARVVTTNDVLLTNSPFAGSPWRQAENAALWDLGPHAISFLAAVLGPVASVRAVSSDRVISLSCAHAGQRSEAVCSLASETGEVGAELVDGHGNRESPSFSLDAASAYANAVTVLLEGPRTRCQRTVADLAFSLHVIAVLEAAAESLAGAGRWVRIDDREALGTPVFGADWEP